MIGFFSKFPGGPDRIPDSWRQEEKPGQEEEKPLTIDNLQFPSKETNACLAGLIAIIRHNILRLPYKRLRKNCVTYWNHVRLNSCWARHVF